MRFRRGFAAAGVLGLTAALACSPVKTAAPVPGVDDSLRPFLLDPAQPCGSLSGGGAEAASAEIHRAYLELLRTADAARAIGAAEAALRRDPGRLAAQTLRAQALLVAGRPREGAAALGPFAAAARDCLPLALALGRSHEEAGEIPDAYAVYLGAAEHSATAAQQARALSSRALEMTHDRFVEALRSGRTEAAAWQRSRLERFWPNSEATLQAAMELARGTEDRGGELAAAKALQAFRPADAGLTLRRAQLELLVGDARTGLALIEGLAAAAPDDAEVAAELARAKFHWRLFNAPEQVRSLRDKLVLTRADFAVLLYWMVPQIRTARPAAARIASDIVAHPSREEIARVANLGLMTIDENLHRFSPDSGLRRSEAVGALLRLLAGSASDCGLPRAGGRDAICSAGVACGLIDDPIQCQAGSSLSGGEAIEILRRALDRPGGS
jgi:hypothetical protein